MTAYWMDASAWLEQMDGDSTVQRTPVPVDLAPEPPPMGPESWHGSLNGYTNHKCRCDYCRAGWMAYFRKRNSR